MTAQSEDMALVAEGSVPVSGFSRELREAEDVERYRFSWSPRGEAGLPVHIVFSASRSAAEVKTGDRKVLRLSGVGSAEEARDRWIAWCQRGGSRPAFVGPRRTGRHPGVRHAGV